MTTQMIERQISEACERIEQLRRERDAAPTTEARDLLLEQIHQVQQEQVQIQAEYEAEWREALAATMPHIRVKDYPEGRFFYLIRSVPGMGGTSTAVGPQHPDYANVKAVYEAQQASRS